MIDVSNIETEDELRERVVEAGIPWWPFTRTIEYETWSEAHPVVAAFDPTLHPHRPAGDARGGEWAPKAASAPGYQQAKLDVDAREFAELNKRFRDDPAAFFPQDGSKDGALAEIVGLQGYDGLPQVVTEEEFAPRLSHWDDRGYRTNEGDGTIELWRGVQPVEGRPAGDLVEQFRSGPYFIGEGVYGNGTYATPIRQTAHAYTWDGVDEHPDGVMHMGLRPDAKIVDMEDSDFQDNWKTAAYGPGGPYKNSMIPKNHLFLDAGRYAAARGYDGMKTPDGNYVIFNRTALIVTR